MRTRSDIGMLHDGRTQWPTVAADAVSGVTCPRRGRGVCHLWDARGRRRAAARRVSDGPRRRLRVAPRSLYQRRAASNLPQ
ncbi:hypothetical protein V5799_013005 [Amblyomma americanum]|uniref:Uncharacterized protein n=1 Tax=Amblyomma americanum TaxID=6943 RepID=A0AAQ4E733_AMBAM